MSRTLTNSTGSRVHYRDEDEVMEEAPEPPCKKRLSPSSPSPEVVMEDLQLPCSAKLPARAFHESVSLAVDVKTLYSILPSSVGGDEMKTMCLGGMVRVEAKQLSEEENKTFCVLCDGSGSMGGQRYADLCLALEAAVAFLRETGRTNNKLAVVRFDSEASVIYGPAEIPSDAQLKEIIEKLRPAGGTDIEKALKVFQDEVSAPLLLKGESVMGVLITDGDDYTLKCSVRDGARCTETTRKLGSVSGETIHYLAVSLGADMNLLKTLAEMSNSTCNRVETASIPEVLGSALGLEKVEHIVEVTVDVGVPGETKTRLITKKRINLRYSKDDEPAPTDVSIQLPSIEAAALEVDVKVEVYDFGYVESGVTAPIFTQDKTFTLTAAASEEEFSLAMKNPCLEYILYAAKRARGSVDGKVAGFLSKPDINGAIAAVDEGIESIKKYANLTSDQTTAVALAITVGELEAQRVQLEASRTEKARLNDIRDRAYSEAMTDRNSLSVHGRGQSNSQNSARTLSAVMARTISDSRSQDLRSFSNVSGFGDLRVDSSRSSTGASNFGNMRLNSATPAVIEEPENESQDF